MLYKVTNSISTLEDKNVQIQPKKVHRKYKEKDDDDQSKKPNTRYYGRLKYKSETRFHTRHFVIYQTSMSYIKFNDI